MLSKSIFRQYDIRGKVGEEFDVEGAGKIAQAFASYVSKKGLRQVLLGRDNRQSSLAIRDKAVAVLLAGGLDVVDIGEVITPMFYFAGKHLGIQAGIMITASHNPGHDNGFKLLLGDSTMYGEQIQEIGVMAMAADNYSYEVKERGNIELMDISEPYIKAITDRIKLGPRQLKVVIDCGNGTAGFIAPPLFKKLGCEVVELFCDSDSNFPNHHPDPVKTENCQDLIRVVKSEKADLGLGFDGDGDRLGVVDASGNIIWGDTLMIIFWREILGKYPGAECIVEVKCSQALIDEIKRLGGKPMIYKTGHSLIKAKMKDIGAVFAGEMSGHMFFADEYYGYDDALYAAARLLRIVSRADRSLSALITDVPQYFATPEIRIKTTDIEKFVMVDKVLNHFRPRYEIIDIDGARILFPEGWGLIRASNTGPELIVRCEGNTIEAREQIKAEIFAYLTECGLKIC